jgi:hypothetical protein
MKMSAKKTATEKKTTAKNVSKKNGTDKKVGSKHVTEDQAVVFKLLCRENGATLADMQAAGYNWPAQAVLKMAERNGFKTSQKKTEGERTRYFARRV